MHTNYNNARKAHPQRQGQINSAANSAANMNGVYQQISNLPTNYPHSALPNGYQPPMTAPYLGPHNGRSGNAFDTAAPITDSAPSVVGGEPPGKSTFEYCIGLWKEAENKAGMPLWAKYAPVVKDSNVEPTVRNFVSRCSTQALPEKSGVKLVQASDTDSGDYYNTGIW